jgi:hypothetical protein
MLQSSEHEDTHMRACRLDSTRTLTAFVSSLTRPDCHCRTVQSRLFRSAPARLCIQREAPNVAPSRTAEFEGIRIDLTTHKLRLRSKLARSKNLGPLLANLNLCHFCSRIASLHSPHPYTWPNHNRPSAFASSSRSRSRSARLQCYREVTVLRRSRMRSRARRPRRPHPLCCRGACAE